VRDLLWLRQKVDRETTGANPNKDAYAYETLKLAAMLFDTLAGWARNHTIGRILQRLPPVRYAPGTTREKELGDARPWDDAGLEPIGESYDFSDAEANKRIVREFAETLPAVLGDGLARELYEAFDELLFGGRHDLVRPSPTSLKGDARALWDLRFRATQHVYFQIGQGITKGEAQDRVATAYGFDENPNAPGRGTLTKWEQRLGKHFEEFMIEDTLALAQSDGAWYSANSTKDDLDRVARNHLKLVDRRFGAVALEIDGRRYQELTGRKPAFESGS